MTEPGLDIRDAFFDRLYDIAAADNNVLFLTADMGALSLERFKKDINGQYINMGVAEQNMINIATGLALGGKKVFVYAIAPFATMRCFEQIKVNISGMGLPITIIGAGPGITYNSDGPTHHAVQDVAIMRALPGMTIFNPSDPVMASGMAAMSYESEKPVYVRIDKGRLPLLYSPEQDLSDGLSLLKDGQDLLIVATGLMVHKGLRLAEELEKYSIRTGVLDLYRIKPVNVSLLLRYAHRYSRIVTLEEHSTVGGIGSTVLEALADHGAGIPVKRFALYDRYCERHGDREWMHVQHGLDDSSILNHIRTWS
ncbi:MAG: transketolase C-terminal domain-containing protein [Syntrophorhabdaceae bacterium]|nr:transketolase C-terminal domain-containing protein [Syntrophorhabdaceae bacterium]